MKIAVLLTCFNRKKKTLKCLSSLFAISNFDVYLVDDASTDGTSEEIQVQYPSVNIIKGNGNLFWNRGMYLAWSYALNDNYDYYLWLNDDVVLYPFFFDELMRSNLFGNKHCIISGLVENYEKTKILYV
jgi:GT2 family glycosyltransferase